MHQEKDKYRISRRWRQLLHREDQNSIAIYSLISTASLWLGITKRTEFLKVALNELQREYEKRIILGLPVSKTVQSQCGGSA